MYINNSVLDSDIHNILSTCDYFIYQPLSSIYPVYNTDNLKTYLKLSCKCISFPYIFNDAFTPLYKSIKRDIPINGEYDKIGGEDIIYRNIEPIIELKKMGLSLDDILVKYNNNEINFRYMDRFNKTINILREKEKNTDVKVSQFIIDNHKQYKLFNYHVNDNNFTYCNHPSNILIMHYTNQIFEIMGLDPIVLDNNELIGTTLYVSKYDILYYDYKWIDKESEYNNMRIKQLIIEIYNTF
jgi:hypothetical protein